MFIKSSSVLGATVALVGAIGCAVEGDEPSTSVAAAESLQVHVDLTGAVHTTARSGFGGQEFTIGTATDDEYALWAVYGKERSDDPCWIRVRAESINDINDHVPDSIDLCGSAGPNDSSLLDPDFANGDFTGERAFLSGIKVCMNGDHSKVKGWILYGRTINSNGSLTDLTLSALGGPRPNCDTWQPRVDCPAGQIATAIVASFDTSSEPRAWTGVALKCRTVSPTVAPMFP